MTVSRIAVGASTGPYEVVIGSGVLAEAGAYVAEAVGSTEVELLIVYDAALAPFGYVEQVQASLASVFKAVHSISVPSGEASKSFAQAQRLYSACIASGLDRSAVIVALGGGVTGDLAGFIAATYMRGVRFVQMPTTLLAHDSSIGGKVAINLPEGKNLIGAFLAPQLVLYDVATLRSLSLAERANGLAEALKHGVIRDAQLFDWMTQHAARLLAGDEELTCELLARSCQIKVDVVGQDERETGLRAILNFGHTVGHAIEALEEGRLAHGCAVAIGMVHEAKIAVALSLTEQATVERLEFALQHLSLPTTLPASLCTDEGITALIEWMRHDKKAVRRSLSFVLPQAIGRVDIYKDVPEKTVRQVLASSATGRPANY